MDIKEVNYSNITILFSNPLNHNYFSQKFLLDLFSSKNKDLNKNTFIEAPGYKIIQFLNRKIEIVFEVNRILINERIGNFPQKIEVFDYLDKLLKSDYLPKNEIVAYGFNFDIVIDNDKNNFLNKELREFVVSKINDDIENIGLSFNFNSKDSNFGFNIKPGSNLTGKVFINVNVNFNSNTIPSKKDLEKNMLKSFEQIKKILKKL